MVSLWWGREGPKFLDKYTEGIYKKVTAVKACVVSTGYAQRGGRRGESTGRHLGFQVIQACNERMTTWAEWIGCLTDSLIFSWSSPHSIHFTNLRVAEALHLWNQSFSRLYRSIDPSPGSITTSTPECEKFCTSWADTYREPHQCLGDESSLWVQNISISYSKFCPLWLQGKSYPIPPTWFMTLNLRVC